MKTTLLLSVLAVSMLLPAPAGALSGGPSQFMPPYPYPSHGGGYVYTYHHRHHVDRHRVRKYATGEGAK